MRCDAPSSASSCARRSRTSTPPRSSRSDTAQHGDLDLVRVAPDIVAVAAQDVDLVGEVEIEWRREIEQVAGIGVLGHQAQGAPLPATADQDRRPVRTRAVQGTLEMEMLAGERRLVVVPHVVRELQGLLEKGEPLQPAPRPSTTRPPVSTSSVLTALSRSPGGRLFVHVTRAPTVNRSVRPAQYASVAYTSSIGASTGLPVTWNWKR